MDTILDMRLPLSSPESINVRELAAMNYADFRDWLPPNRKGAESNLLARLEYCRLRLSSLVGAGEIDSLFGDLSVLSDAEKSSTAILRYVPVVYLAAYFASHLDYSCHEIFFGMRETVEIPGKIKSFLMDIQKLSPSKRKAIGDLLKKGRLDGVTNPYVFMRQRAFEAANDAAIPESYLPQIGADRVYQNDIVTRIFSDCLQYKYDKRDTSVLQVGTGKFLTLLLFCTKLKQSADFFLLQDYSKYAVIDGKPLTDTQRKWLSHYLCASFSIQDAAICQMAVAMLEEKIE